MSEERMKYIEKCQKFVRQVDTLVIPSSDLELERYRKVGAILEERAEVRSAKSGSEYLEEQRDVMFYCLSLLNYLETYGGAYPRRLQRPMTPDYHITSFEEYLGILKKITRSGDRSITRADYSLYCFTWEYVDTRLDDRFIECMTKKLLKKFPEHCKEWGLKEPLPQLQQDVWDSIPSQWEETFEKQMQKGLKKYGRLLTVEPNGRDSIQDLQEELVDALNYTCQALMQGRKEEVANQLRYYICSMNSLLLRF